MPTPSESINNPLGNWEKRRVFCTKQVIYGKSRWCILYRYNSRLTGFHIWHIEEWSTGQESMWASSTLLRICHAMCRRALPEWIIAPKTYCTNIFGIPVLCQPTYNLNEKCPLSKEMRLQIIMPVTREVWNLTIVLWCRSGRRHASPHPSLVHKQIRNLILISILRDIFPVNMVKRHQT